MQVSCNGQGKARRELFLSFCGCSFTGFICGIICGVSVLRVRVGQINVCSTVTGRIFYVFFILNFFKKHIFVIPPCSSPLY
uniref:Transmembrane protein n=1 Tax=Anguilla anguilla TaxID=7936 RepID=A0A0E9X747_ANGAN